MLLGKQVNVLVFELNNSTFEAIGEIDNLKSIQWNEAYQGCSSFEFWCPIDSKNVELCKKGNVIWLGGETAGLIEIVNPQVDEDYTRVFNVKGRTLECFLSRRILWGTFSSEENDDVATSMQAMVDFNFVSLTRDQLDYGLQSRKFPWFEIDRSYTSGIKTAMQRTGGDVYDNLLEVAQNNGLGFRVVFLPNNKKLRFKVFKGQDRTINSSNPIVFDSDMEDLLSSSYYTNDQDYKNVSFVAGEGKGYSRSWVITGEKNLTGFERRELYVDARDVQSESMDEAGNTKILTEQEYNETLTQRGDDKLAERAMVESFDSKIRVVGNVNYEFNKDYFVGDTVTVIDRELGVQVDAQITNAEEAWSDNYELLITFGFSQPTILQKVKYIVR